MIDIRDAFFNELYDIASKDRDVVFLTADMGAWSLSKFKKDLPDQYINVGVAEQNLVSVAAGLALAGKKVFIYSIASFITQRCYEQIKIDLCQMRLPVTIIGSGPGLTYGSDGPTHHAVNDVVIMSALPGMTIITPRDAGEAKKAVSIAYQSQTPVYVRLGRGKLPSAYGQYKDYYSDIPFILDHGLSKERQYLPSFAELVELLINDQIKEVLMPEYKDIIAQEMREVGHDVDLIIQERRLRLSARLIRTIIAIAQINLHIWHSKDNMQNDPEKYLDYLKFAHQLNGIRNQMKNLLSEEVGDKQASRKTNLSTDELKGWDISIDG